MQHDNRKDSISGPVKARISKKPYIKKEHIKIIKLLATDYTLKELSNLLNIKSVYFLMNKVNYLIAKFGCKNRTSLVVYALKNRIIKLEDL